MKHGGKAIILQEQFYQILKDLQKNNWILIGIEKSPAGTLVVRVVEKEPTK